MPSALKRVAAEANAEGDSNKARKGSGKGVEDSHVNARLLRQLESRVRTLEFGSGLVVYGPSDDQYVDTLKQTYQEYQKKVEGKNNTHGLGPPELQNFAALLSAFNSWLDKPGKAQDSVKELADIPRRLILMMMKGDQEQASTWIKECGTSSTADSSISRITVKVLGFITLPDPNQAGPNAYEEQESLWKVLEDKDVEEGEKRGAEVRVIRSPLEPGHGKVIAVEQ